MDTIHPIRAIDQYQDNTGWFTASLGQASSSPRPMSDLMANYQFARYAQDLYARTAAEGIAGVLSSAKRLQDTARTLQAKDSTVLEQRKAASDTTAVSAAAVHGALLGSHQVQVDAVAKAQVNSGATFVKTSTTSIRSGWNEFNIHTDNRTTRVSFWANSVDTHEQTLKKMSQAVNHSDAGVTASTVTDSTGKITLELRGDITGTAHGFTVTDLTGNAVAATGSHLVSESAQNAAYRIDGGAVKTSESNRILLDEGRLEVTLHKTTPAQAATVTVGSDQDAIVNRVEQLVNDYNDLKASAGRTPGFVSPSVEHRIRNALSGAGLDRLGIERQSDGSLKLDKKKLVNLIATHFDGVKAEIGGVGGIASRLEKLSGRLQQAPADSLLDRRNREYMRYANYQSTMELYSQLPFNGRLVNRMF